MSMEPWDVRLRRGVAENLRRVVDLRERFHWRERSRSFLRELLLRVERGAREMRLRLEGPRDGRADTAMVDLTGLETRTAAVVSATNVGGTPPVARTVELPPTTAPPVIPALAPVEAVAIGVSVPGSAEGEMPAAVPEKKPVRKRAQRKTPAKPRAKSTAEKKTATTKRRVTGTRRKPAARARATATKKAPVVEESAAGPVEAGPEAAAQEKASGGSTSAA